MNHCEMTGSPDTLQLLLATFASIASSKVLESTVLGQPELVWSMRFLQTKHNFLNHLVIMINFAFTFCSTDIYCCCHNVIDQFELISSWIKLCFPFISTGFQISHIVKQYTTCQCTNYHNTTNYFWYVSQLELLHSHRTDTTDQHVPKYCKTFDSPMW